MTELKQTESQDAVLSGLAIKEPVLLTSDQTDLMLQLMSQVSSHGADFLEQHISWLSDPDCFYDNQSPDISFMQYLTPTDIAQIMYVGYRLIEPFNLEREIERIEDMSDNPYAPDDYEHDGWNRGHSTAVNSILDLIKKLGDSCINIPVPEDTPSKRKRLQESSPFAEIRPNDENRLARGLTQTEIQYPAATGNLDEVEKSAEARRIELLKKLPGAGYPIPFNETAPLPRAGYPIPFKEAMPQPPAPLPQVPFVPPSLD